MISGWRNQRKRNARPSATTKTTARSWTIRISALVISDRTRNTAGHKWRRFFRAPRAESVEIAPARGEEDVVRHLDLLRVGRGGRRAEGDRKRHVHDRHRALTSQPRDPGSDDGHPGTFGTDPAGSRRQRGPVSREAGARRRSAGDPGAARQYGSAGPRGGVVREVPARRSSGSGGRRRLTLRNRARVIPPDRERRNTRRRSDRDEDRDRTPRGDRSGGRRRPPLRRPSGPDAEPRPPRRSVESESTRRDARGRGGVRAPREGARNARDQRRGETGGPRAGLPLRFARG